ncbi:CpsD/CapB family tyrosine-protein kinase [Metabacillus litoralis]|uniref:CpsD/CapB family tyrosine-protein kinase n=1 Tax=Metabacillus TaxID=2675233 RepID=UPI001E2CD0D9|nr:CpsD/CapB family tyrosine-protein kinase [Metabacillus litoralis]MCM3412414.1 CpsD/CapB family tyrosine-protein kinase [Metabacillus litoralis]UHA57876.1 CpsD/CapB family tyrosine-protein kinase [Metabacillus litoralis]
MVLSLINKNKAMKEITRRHFVSHTYPNSEIAERFRTIRTNIQFSSIDKKHQLLMITSPSNGEGKTTAAVNLAISISQQGEKVLLIDANLRRPKLQQAFNIKETKGLTDVLIEGIPLEEAVFQTQIGQLDVLSSGTIPPNPAEIIGSGAMSRFLIEARKEYNVVIFDCPPVLETTETKLLAGQCDGVVLTLNSGRTDQEKALEANRLLKLVRANVLGVILNAGE